MARKGKTVVGQTNSAPAQRQFTDREEPQESFIKALKEVSDREYSILTYYGVGGIGKSSLQAHLKSHHLDKNGDSIYSSIDFDRESNRMPYNTFRTLADKFKTNFKVPFTAFDIAYTIYWSKANPNVELKQESLPFLEEGGLLSGTIDLLDSVGGMASVALSAVDYAAKKIKDRSFNITIQEELKKLDSLEAEQIEDRLGFFFAYDIDNYKKKHPQKKVVIFLDTYEALWQNVRNESNRLSQD
ncbi:MAG: hypothetical protein U9N39_08745, partial [Campylobacterota bacterium]|nr:hypothetical protein [Campylobacterota bacterium]